MKKAVSIGLLLMVVVLVFSGCGTSQWKDLGMDFAENIFTGDYESAAKQMDASLTENFTEEIMTSMVDSVTSQYGAYQSVISATVGNDSNYPDYKIVKVNVQLEKGKIQLELAYDDTKLSGINLLGSEEQTTGNSDAADYRSEAKNFLTYLFDGDTASGYAMLNDTAKQTYTEDNLAKIKEEAEATYGTFDSFGPASQSGNTVTVNMDFEKGTAAMIIDFDSSGAISDISVSGTAE